VSKKALAALVVAGLLLVLGASRVPMNDKLIALNQEVEAQWDSLGSGGGASP
jgi:hypothetical protein